MKTITKTFYASDDFIKLINEGMDINEIIENNCDLKDEKSMLHKNQIQISWQESEKKIEITESRLDEIIKDIKLQFQQRSYGSYAGKVDDLVNVNFEMVRVIDLKQKLFGNREG